MRKIINNKLLYLFHLKKAILPIAWTSVVAVMFTVVLVERTQPSSITYSKSNSIEPVEYVAMDVESMKAVAATLASKIELPEATALRNEADSSTVNATHALSSSSGDASVIAKPLILGAVPKTKADIIDYTTVDGDTISSLASVFGVTSDSIRWSNNLDSNASLSPGKVLAIPPITGIVYVVTQSDTPRSLAIKYSTSEQGIITFNDAEISGLSVNDRIVIPNGRIQDAVVPGIAGVGNTGFSFGTKAIYGYNGYEAGNCTWYAAKRRIDAGKPMPANLGNAITWVKGAQLAGMEIGNTPQVGAIYWKPLSMLSGTYAKYGHVGIVDEILPDGSVKVSSMNVRGLYSMGYQTFTAEQATAYTYIY